MAAGFGVLGYDIDPAKNARLAERGGKAAASPAEVAACGVIALAVFSTDQVEEVVEKALLPARRRPARSCSAPAPAIRTGSRRWAGGSPAASIRFLETPVSGTSEQVRQGDGVGLIGGDPKTAEEIAPVLDALFPRRFHIGKVGDGGRAKLAVNLILGLNRMALAEGLAFAERMGLDPEGVPRRWRRARRRYSQVMETKGAKMLARRFRAGGPRQADAQGRAHDARSGASSSARSCRCCKVHCDVLEACVRAGEAERDNSIIVEEIRRRAQITRVTLTSTPCAAFDRRSTFFHRKGCCHADVVLRSRRVLDGFAYRAGGERREIRAQAHGPRQGRAAHRGVSEDEPAGPRAAAATRQRRAARREHRDPAVSRQALQAVADGRDGRGQGAVD